MRFPIVTRQLPPFINHSNRSFSAVSTVSFPAKQFRTVSFPTKQFRTVSVAANPLARACRHLPVQTRSIITMSSLTSGASSAAHPQADSTKPAVNHLANSTSPYLLQHKHDPVDWYEFTDEAFQKAKQENKLVFLSIGYSSCHWCHQMRYDSFSHPQVAQVLNRDFVSIKVDREERPDVDATYMQFVVALNGSGGWPLTAFLTPDAKPIFGGTFFPRQQFLTVLDTLSTMWSDDRQNVLKSANSIAHQLSIQLGPRSGSKLPHLPSPKLAIKAAQLYLKRFDNEYGGFSMAPKFPTVSNTHHFLHRFVATVNRGQIAELSEAAQMSTAALEASIYTLLMISRGGITDQLGGGVARYSVDDEWRVPHFEKMLYDQDQLLTVFVEAIQLARQSKVAKLDEAIPELEAAARGIVTYLYRDLSHPGGGFFSAEDADSLPSENSVQKKEGAFYVWRQSEIENVLGKDSIEAQVTISHYGIQADGNIPDESDPHGELTGTNMLHATGSIADTASKLGIDVEAAQHHLETAKAKMFEYRNQKKPRPHLDDKIISSWNGLAITGLCKAAEVLSTCPGGGQQARQMAVKCADFLIQHLYDADQNKLRRSWRDGYPGPLGFSSDYAFVAQAMLDLFELQGDPSYLELAVKLQYRLDQSFWDNEVGGYYISEDRASRGKQCEGTGDGSSLLTRQKEEQDGAEPSALSVTTHNLLRLSRMLDQEPEDFKTEMTWQQRRDAAIQSGGVVFEQVPFAFGTMLTALLGIYDGGTQIVISGPRIVQSAQIDQDETAAKNAKEQEEKEKAKQMMKEIHKRFLPFRTLIQVDTEQVISSDNPLALLGQCNTAVKQILETKQDIVQAHVCNQFVCGLAIRDPEQLGNAIEN